MVKKSLADRNLFNIILILAPLVFTFALAIDIYVPSIPAIKTELNVGTVAMQLTMSLFILIAGLGQLFVGPISDQFGRRLVALTSVSIFVLGSLCCCVAPGITILIIGRMIQALGACGMMVSAFAIVRDIFSGDDCARVYSFLNSTIAISPLFAPVIGGYLEYWISWRASFAFLAIIGIIILYVIYENINETFKHSASKQKLIKIFKSDYKKLIKNKKFMIYTFCAAVGFAGFITFVSSAAYILITLLRIPEQHFGFYFASIGILFFIGSLISGHCAKRYGTYLTVLFGGILMCVSGIVMIFWYLHFGLSTLAFMGPMMIMGVGGAMLMGAGAGGAIEPFPEIAGAASALFGCIEFIFAFAISQLVLMWHVTSTVPLALTLTIGGLCAFVILGLFYDDMRKKRW